MTTKASLRPGDLLRVPHGTYGYAALTNDTHSQRLAGRGVALVVQSQGRPDGWIRGAVDGALWWFYPGPRPERIVVK